MNLVDESQDYSMAGLLLWLANFSISSGLGGPATLSTVYSGNGLTIHMSI